MDNPPHLRHGRLQEPWWTLQESDEHNQTIAPDNNSFSDTSVFTAEYISGANISDPNVTDVVCAANHTFRSEVDPEVFVYAASFLIVFCTVSLIVNVIILCSVCFMRTRVNPTLYISVSLAGADTFSLFFFAIGLFLFTLLPRLGILIAAPCVMLMIEALRMGAILTTMFHLAALAGNHYLGILLPLRYPVYMTRRNIQYCIVILWTVPLSLLILDMFYLEGDGFDKCPYDFLKREQFRTRFSVPFFTCLGMMIFIYLHIYKLVVKHLDDKIGNGKRSVKKYRNSGVNEKAIITTLMILGSTIFGWLPAFIHFALFCQDCLLCKYWNRGTVEEFVILLTINFLLICKTATNSYIYAFRVKEIKVALRRMRRTLLECLCPPPDDTAAYNLSVWTRGRYNSTSFSRQSTSKGDRTLVYRMNSVKDSPPLLNGTSRQSLRVHSFRPNQSFGSRGKAMKNNTSV